MKTTSSNNRAFRSPKNGSTGTNVPNLPSTTGNPSGKGRGNNSSGTKGK